MVLDLKCRGVNPGFYLRNGQVPLPGKRKDVRGAIDSTEHHMFYRRSHGHSKDLADVVGSQLPSAGMAGRLCSPATSRVLCPNEEDPGHLMLWTSTMMYFLNPDRRSLDTRIGMVDSFHQPSPA